MKPKKCPSCGQHSVTHKPDGILLIAGCCYCDYRKVVDIKK